MVIFHTTITYIYYDDNVNLTISSSIARRSWLYIDDAEDRVG